MNNNLVSERALRDVFETASSINIGTAADPSPYGFKPDVRSSEKGKQFQTEPPKQGNLPRALFQKEWPWVNDGNPYIDKLRYADSQKERFRGFLDSDFSRRDEFSSSLRTEQYREQLKRENKHSKKNIETSKQKLDQLKEKYELEKPAQRTQFDGPKYLYDINRSAVTPQCLRCKKDTYFCPHRAAYNTNNPHLEKEKGSMRTSSEEIGGMAKQCNYAKPEFARKPIIKDTFYRCQNVFFPSKTKTNSLNQGLST